MPTSPEPAPHERWISPTTDYWQRFEPLAAWRDRLAPPYRHGLPVLLEADRVLTLPIRRLPDPPGRAVASLISNQASLEVVDWLAQAMGNLARPWQAEVLVGLPTLGMAFAPGVARTLGHARWVPMGYSRKFWYDEAMATTVRSITTPGSGKPIYLDPNQWPLLRARRVVIVDDVVSSAQTLVQVWGLLQMLGAEVVGCVVAMRQGTAWADALGEVRAARVLGVFDTPQLEWRADGWWPLQLQPAAA